MFIAMDLDDTLMRKDKSISDYSLKVLKKLQEKGHIIIIDTARNVEMTISTIDLLKPDFSICNAGAIIFDKDKKIIYEDFIDEETTNKVVLELFPFTTNISIQTRDILYTTNINNTNPKAQYHDVSKGCFFKAHKILPYKLNDEEAKKIKEKYNLEFTRYFHGDWARFSKLSVTKLEGLRNIVKYCNGSMDDTISFGDDHGDLEMLRGSRIGVAMANSQEEVLKEVSVVTDNCNEDGVAKFLDNYFNLNILELWGKNYEKIN